MSQESPLVSLSENEGWVRFGFPPVWSAEQNTSPTEYSPRKVLHGRIREKLMISPLPGTSEALRNPGMTKPRLARVSHLTFLILLSSWCSTENTLGNVGTDDL